MRIVGFGMVLFIIIIAYDFSRSYSYNETTLWLIIFDSHTYFDTYTEGGNFLKKFLESCLRIVLEYCEIFL